MKNIGNELAIFLHIQGLKMKDDHLEPFGRQQIKGKWGSFVTGRIRVFILATQKVGFRQQNPKKTSWVASLDWRESLVG